MSELFELTDGTLTQVVAEYAQRDFTAYVLHRPTDVGISYVGEYVGGWIVTWTDGINWWFEDDYELPWHALARLAALVAAVEQDVFLVHDLQDGNPAARAAVVDEVDRFVSRTVHASSCRPGCDGTDPVNHQV